MIYWRKNGATEQKPPLTLRFGTKCLKKIFLSDCTEIPILLITKCDCSFHFIWMMSYAASLSATTQSRVTFWYLCHPTVNPIFWVIFSSAFGVEWNVLNTSLANVAKGTKWDGEGESFQQTEAKAKIIDRCEVHLEFVAKPQNAKKI